MEKTYRPLPKGLTIKSSKIDGLGLFAERFIALGEVLGIAHIRDTRFQDNYIRTPLAGFINHSDNSNLEVVVEDDFRYVVANREIEATEELTLTYTLYKIDT